MAIKYISKNKDDVWKVSTTKTGKAIKTFKTQKEAIAYAGTIQNTESILIKRESGWAQATGWDLNVAKEAEKVVKNSKAQGKSTRHAKAKAVAKATDTPTEQIEIKTQSLTLATKEDVQKAESKKENTQKVEVKKSDEAKEKKSVKHVAKKAHHHFKKHKKSYYGWMAFYVFLILAVAAGILIYYFLYK